MLGRAEEAGRREVRPPDEIQPFPEQHDAGDVWGVRGELQGEGFWVLQ